MEKGSVRVRCRAGPIPVYVDPLAGTFSVSNSIRGLTSAQAGYLNQLAIGSNPENRYRAYRAIGRQNSNFAWDFYAKTVRNDQKVLMELTDEVSEKLTVALQFGDNGQIRNYYSGVWHDLMPYDSNTWYEFSVYNVNLAIGRYDLKINDRFSGTNFLFHEFSTNIAHMTFVGDAIVRGAAWFDDVRIRRYSGVNPTSSFGPMETSTQLVAIVTLHDLIQTYSNGMPLIVTATTEPGGLDVLITYNGSTNPPTDAGSYTVTGIVVNSTSYQGVAVGTLVVSPANQTINFPNPGTQIVNNPVGLSATASSGLPVIFTVLPGGPGVITDGTNLTFTGTGTVVVVASQPGNLNWNAAPNVTNIIVVVEASKEWYTLSVVSAYGTPMPGVGIYTNEEDTVLTASMTTPSVDDGTTQYVCVGWSIVGNDATGSSTQMTMTVTNDAELTWLWTTNYRLTTVAGLHGSVDPTNSWKPFGSVVSITAMPDIYYHFTNWTGDASGSVNPLSLTMNGPKSVTAWFGENVVTNCTPEWWLAGYGLNNAAAISDTDGDGKVGWQEYWANTDPTNPLSVFKLHVVSKTNEAGYVIGWTIGSGRLFSISFTTNYAEGPWSILATGLSAEGVITDEVNGVTSPIWYRGNILNPCEQP